MAEMSWRDAAKKVLGDAGGPLHYKDIADRILGQGLKDHGRRNASFDRQCHHQYRDPEGRVGWGV